MSNPSTAAPRAVDFLLLGGGLASATAAETLRREGAAGSILLLSAEALPPYHRPPLSKQRLLGTQPEADILIHPATFYTEQRIKLMLDTRAVSLDTQRRVVRTANGDEVGYGKLLIATGAVPKQCTAPGSRLRGIFTLRTVADCDAVRHAGGAARRAVVLGASFLGMEIAATLARRGLEVTVIERGGRIMPHLEAAVLSDFFEARGRARGLSFVTRDTAARFIGHERVEAVETVAGRRIPADLVVVSIGVDPATEFLADSGIALDEDRHVIVDALLRTNDPDVFAAGDMVSFDDPVFGRRRHIEHWDNAIKQGRLAAKNMLGRRSRYDEVSYFYCEIGDTGFNMLGAPEEGRTLVSRGRLDDASFGLFYLDGSVARAFFSFGRSADETRLVEGLIRHRVNLGSVRDRLADPDYTLAHIPTQTVLILQGGGALGAFECGVVKALEEAAIHPDIVAGVSIGAINGAIVAANPRHATAALEAFWGELEVLTPCLPFAEMRHTAVAANILAFGVPRFFRPRWIPPFDGTATAPWTWTSYYDVSPLRELIARYVDFTTLKASPVRLLVGAVDVATARLEVFDSYVDDLTPDHILASGSLPPAFPWTVIDGRAYWDGGIVSNSPLDIVIDRCGPDGKRIFIVDLFAGARQLPTNIVEVMARRDEIVYSERVRSDLRAQEVIDSYRGLIDVILTQMDPAAAKRVMQWPNYVQLMGDGAPMTVTRFVRQGKPGEPPSRDYDFSRTAIRASMAEGYATVQRALAPTPLPEGGDATGNPAAR